MRKIGLEAIFEDREFHSRINRYMATIDKVNKKNVDMSKSFKNNAKSMSSVDSMVGNLRQTMEVNLTEMQKQDEAIQKQVLSLDDWAGGLKIVGTALAAVGAAGGALIYSSVRLAARVETLGIVTERLGKNLGMTKKEVRELEQSIVDQGITLQKARTGIALMAQAQVDLAKGTDLARAAQDTAVIANIDSSEAFQRLVYTISTGNVRMARTLGLQVSFQQSYEDLADTLGITAQQLSTQEKVLARTNEVLRASSTVLGVYDAAMTTAGKKVLSLNRHIEESRRILGETFLPVFADLVDGVTNFLKKWEELDPAMQRVISISLGAATTFAILAGATLLLGSAYLSMAANAAIAGVAIGATVLPITAVVAILGALAISIVAVNTARKEEIRILRELTDDLFETSETYADYVKGLEEVAKEEERAIITREKHDELVKRGRGGIILAAEAIIQESDAHFRNSKFLREENELRADVRVTYREGLEIAKEKEKQDIKSIISSELLTVSTDEQREALFKLLRELDETGPTDEARRAFERLRDEMTIELEAAQMEEDARRLKETLQREFQDLQTLINFQLMPSFEDFTDSLQDVADKEQDIHDRMADVNEQVTKYRKEITKIRAGDEGLFSDDEQTRIDGINGKIAEYLEKIEEIEDKPGIITEEQRKRIELAQEEINRYRQEIEAIADEKEPFSDEQNDKVGTYNERISDANERLAELQGELDEIPGKVDEVRDAWDRQTKTMIFNLAAQRLAADGLTSEELKALGILAGPKGFGLIDQAGLGMINAIADTADILDLAGDQSEIFNEALIELQGGVGNTEGTIFDLREELERLAEGEYEFNIRWGFTGPLAGRGEQLMDWLLSGFSPKGATGMIEWKGPRSYNRAAGGRLTGADIVGEQGPELIVGNMVYSANKTQRFLDALVGLMNVPSQLLSMRQATSTPPPTYNTSTSTTYGDQNYNLHIHTSAKAEPIIANFRMMRALGGRD